MSKLNDIKAGTYELVAHQWDEITSKPGEPLDFVRHRRGDLVDLNVEDARRLVLAGAVRKEGDTDAAESVDGPSTPPGGEPSTASTSAQVPVEQDPTGHNISVVKDYVGEDAAKATAILKLEQKAEKPRSTLVEWLETVATAPDPSGGGSGDGSGQD